MTYTCMTRNENCKSYIDGKCLGTRACSYRSNDNEPNYTYIVECADGTYYTGWTNDIIERLHRHNSGSGARYTRSRRPVRLVYMEAHKTKSDAMKREAAIKKLSRQEKKSLIEEKGFGSL